MLVHFTARVRWQADGGRSRPPTLAETNDPRKWVEGLHNEGFRRTPHVLFPSHIGCIYYSNPPRFRLLSSTGTDRPVSGKKTRRGWISFFPPSDGASDQYSHCWLSFGNLYNGVSHRSIARNCLHFQIKRSFFRFFRQ